MEIVNTQDNKSSQGNLYIRDTTRFWNRAGIALIIFACLGGLALMIWASTAASH